MDLNGFLTAKEVRELFRISPATLYHWRKEGRIQYTALSPRKFVYSKDDIEKLLHIQKQYDKMNVIYCRVSNTKQQKDLETQKQILINYCNSHGIIIDKIFSEIASGMNENRKEFNELMKLILDKKINKIFITYKDRFTRFGFEYFNNICKHFNVEIVVLENQINEENFQKELTEDLIAIINNFSMKMHSNRRKQLKEVTKKLEEEA